MSPSLSRSPRINKHPEFDMVGRMRFGKSFLAATSILVSLFIVEVFARVYLASPLALIPRYGNSFQAIHGSKILRASNIEGLRFELKSNLDTFFKLTRFATNSVGMRADREYQKQNRPGTYRVVVLGDSFTMPSGVPVGDAYHNVVERELNAKSDRNYEFLNFGVGGYSLDNYLTVLKEKALAYEPDHVLIGLCLTNDIPVIEQQKKPNAGGFKNRVLSSPQPYFEIWTLDAIGRIGKAMHPKKKGTQQFDLEKLHRLASEFDRIRTQHDLQMTFVGLKLHSRVSRPYELAAEALGKHSLMLIDGGSDFQTQIEARYLTTRLDRHPNALANKMFADTILREIDWDEQGTR